MLPKNELLSVFNNSEDIATAYWNNGVSLADKSEDDIRKAASLKLKTEDYCTIRGIELRAEQKLRLALRCLQNAREIYAAEETKISCDDEISSRENQHELVRKRTYRNAVEVNEYQIPVTEGFNTGQNKRQCYYLRGKSNVHSLQVRKNKIDSNSYTGPGRLMSSAELDEVVNRKFREFFENFVSDKRIDDKLTDARRKDKPKYSKAIKKHFLKLKADRYKKHDLFSQALSTKEQKQFTKGCCDLGYTEV